MTYRRRYFEQMHLGTVLDLLLADESNPRALAFQLETLHEHIENLPKDRWARGEPQEERSLDAVSDLLHGADLGVAAARAESGDIDEVDQVLRRLSEGLCLVSDHLTHRFFSHAVVRAS
jgi:uncharacterized alpha-E superfamily protein